MSPSRARLSQARSASYSQQASAWGSRSRSECLATIFNCTHILDSPISAPEEHHVHRSDP